LVGIAEESSGYRIRPLAPSRCCPAISALELDGSAVTPDDVTRSDVAYDADGQATLPFVALSED